MTLTSTTNPAPAAESPSRIGTLRGVVSLNPRGFGFVTPYDTEQPDVFISPPLARQSVCLDADVVDVTYLAEGERATAQSITLVERPRTRVVGVAVAGELQVDPFVAAAAIPLLRPHPEQRVAVLAELTAQGNARVVRELGHPASPAAVYAQALERSRVAEVVARFANDVATSAPTDRARRVDFTDLVTFTIDGPESRDLDDAISVEPTPAGGWRLYVHIADVASAVPVGSPVDQRAAALATSVYLPGYSIPMIDPTLAYGACSLLEGEERRTLSAVLGVARDGAITAVEVVESRIRSDARLTYTQAAAVLRHGSASGVSTEIARAVRLAGSVANALAGPRAARAGLRSNEAERRADLVVTENAIELAPDDDAAEAHALIEELMVAANEAVAAWLAEHGLPGVFRTHAAPVSAGAAALRAFALTRGLTVDLDDELSPHALSAFELTLSEAGHRDVAVFEVLADYLPRAEYASRVGDHYGLASSGYVHFTSPIRRYADLSVHRIIKAYLAGEPTPTGNLDALCAAINEGASRAARAEAVARSLFFTLLISRRGKTTTYPARVSRVSPRGVFVRLDEFAASGWISARDLTKGAVSVDEAAVTLRAGRDTYVIGQSLRVRPSAINLAAGIVEFALASTPPRSHPGTRRGPRRR